jgi:hypothetical protein
VWLAGLSGTAGSVRMLASHFCGSEQVRISGRGALSLAVLVQAFSAKD